MIKTIEQKIQALWRKVQKEEGYWVSKEVMETIDEGLGQIYDDSDLDDYEGLVREHIALLRLEAEMKYFPTPKKTKDQARQKRYQKPFERRLHLVEFIISKQKLVTSNPNMSHPRIKWKDTCEVWNEAHPYDQMTKEVLKATFFRAAVDEDVRRAFREKRIDEILSTLTSGEHKLLRAKFGLDDKHTWQEVIKDLKMSPEEANDLVMIALRKLRHPNLSDKLINLPPSKREYPMNSESVIDRLNATMEQFFGAQGG